MTETAKAAVAEGLAIRLLAPSPVLFAPNRLYLLVYMLVAIGLYSTAVFPLMPQEFGGGNKPTVNLHLIEPLQAWAGRLDVPISEDGTLGPVRLLLETDTFLVVSRERVNERAWIFIPPALGLRPAEGGAVSIDKKLVAAVEHIKSKHATVAPASDISSGDISL